jgi:type III secretion protein C
MKKIVVLLTGIVAFLLLLTTPLCSDEVLHFDLSPPETPEKSVTVNFQDVSMLEFLRYVSKIAEVNFIYDERILDFRISLVTGKATNPQSILDIMIELLKQQGIKTEERGDYLLVEKMEDWELEEIKEVKLAKYKGRKTEREEIRPVSDLQDSFFLPFHEYEKKGDFHVYKLQYHQGAEILTAIKNVAVDLRQSKSVSPELIKTIGSMQWIQSTNSLLYSGTEEGIDQLSSLIHNLDVPKKQVFIEVLVIETDVKSGQEFGLEWGGGGQYRDKFGYGLGNFPATPRGSPFAKTLQGIDAINTPTGTDQFPIGRGFDLGVIGDIILHKGKSYFSLGSLVSALEAEGNSTIILNQKIITQDNKLSSIFVGDNIPFTGSVVETVGAAQQTSSNIEYRDVGVKLNITPLLGDGDTITLEIAEEITEVVPDLMQASSTVNGIQTTKTDMATQVHVPDQSFLVLSGMIRNTKRHRQSGIPCLGGLPLIGAAFSKTTTNDEKRNVIVFVRPQIIYSSEDYRKVTAYQQQQFKEESGNPEQYQKGIDMLKNEGVTYGTHFNASHRPLTADNRKDPS